VGGYRGRVGTDLSVLWVAIVEELELLFNPKLYLNYRNARAHIHCRNVKKVPVHLCQSCGLVRGELPTAWFTKAHSSMR
jgi:hypothetical protein